MKLILCAFSLLASVVCFSADETVTITAGGQGTFLKLKEKAKELEAAAGARVDFVAYNADLAMTNVAKGVADGFVGSDPSKYLPRLASEKKIPPQNLDDYQSTLLSETTVQAAVHDSNPVKSLTKEQLSGILSGTIKNWKTITGKDAPLTVILASDKVASQQAMSELYLNGGKPVVDYTVDFKGQVRALSRNPNAIAFLTEMNPVDGFQPRYIPTEAKFRVYLTMKKAARPSAQKLFDHVKSLGRFDVKK